MKIRHSWQKNIVEKRTGETTGFLLTNGLGGYLSLPIQSTSRYHGWFFAPRDLAGKKIFKVIENIELPDQPEVSETNNNFWNIERRREDLGERFFLPRGYNSLVYELSKRTKIELFLDVKESYDNQEFGRAYEIFEERNLIIIECRNNEDIFYLVLKADKIDYSKIGQWVFRDYQLDKKRNSYPFERYVYKALNINAQKIVFSVALEKDKAIKESQEVFRKIGKLKKIEKKRTRILFSEAKKNIFKKKVSAEVKMAYLCAQNSLNSMVVFRDKDSCLKNSTGRLYAGLPWFFQFWARDEIISLKPLDKELQKHILLKQFYNIKENSSSDALGWLFQRIGELLKDVKIEETFFDPKGDFDISKAGITWMDTLSRPGAIELQALKLYSYGLAYQATNDVKFLKLEKELRKQVREKFWDGKILADAVDDFTVRPNIFLVAYVYPGLLSKKEWIKCFENSLSKLWLKWGGLATVSKKSPLFMNQHSGEEPGSYHNGDSWFWINNLAALVLCRLNSKKFKRHIDKILEISTEEILWQGVIGHHSELSSANKFKSEGCWAQSWSSALYLELVNYYMTNR